VREYVFLLQHVEYGFDPSRCFWMAGLGAMLKHTQIAENACLAVLFDSFHDIIE
jgi:hypothetical protein